MDNERRFKAWNILDAGLNRESSGHHYWEAKALVDELRSRGETVRLFTHKDAPPAERFPGVEVLPTFSLDPWENTSSDPLWAAMENFFVHTRAFHGDLSAHGPLFDHSVTLFPTFRELHLLGLFRWLRNRPQELRPKAAVCLTSQRSWIPADRSAQLYRTLWDNCEPVLKKDIALFCRTAMAAEWLSTHTGIPAGMLPFLAPVEGLSSTPHSAATTDGPMVISFIAGAKQERGGHLIAEVVEQCAASGVRFFVQAKHVSGDGTEAAALAALARWPHVQVHEGLLERDKYYGAIANSVTLLPYDSVAYRWRDSGVYREALMLDAPVLVPAGTWMAQEVEQRGNGLIIEDLSPSAIVDCIGRAQRELPALRAAAALAGREFRQTQGVARYISTVLDAFRR